MRYGYGRVSSTTRYKGEENNGNSLEAQERRLRDAGCDEIVLEAYTGTTMDRPKFSKLIKRLEPGDTLIVCKLDRFARTASEGVELIKKLLSEGISVHVLNMGLVEDTPTGRLILNIMLAFAEYEKDMIVERLADGKAAAKEKNPEFREGRKPLDIQMLDVVQSLVETGEITVKQACEKLGISRNTYYRRLREA